MNMKIWRASCVVVVLLLVSHVQAQRRGSRRYDNTQVTEQSGEDDEELSQSRSHRFNSQRRSAVTDSRDRSPSRGSSSRQREYDRSESFPSESTITEPNNRSLQSNNRRGKELVFKSRGVSDSTTDINSGRKSSFSRTRGNNNDDQNNNHPTQYQLTRGSSRSVDNRRKEQNVVDKARVIEENRNKIAANDRRPTATFVNISPEEVTFPSQTRHRPSHLEEELIPRTSVTNRGRSRNKNISNGTPSSSQTSETAKFKSRSESIHNPDKDIPVFTRAKTSTHSEQTDQDVESKQNGRRRKLESEIPTSDIPDVTDLNGRKQLVAPLQNVNPLSIDIPTLEVKANKKTFVSDDLRAELKSEAFKPKSRGRTSSKTEYSSITSQQKADSEVSNKRGSSVRRGPENRDGSNIGVSDTKNKRKSFNEQNVQEIQDSFRSRSGKLPPRQVETSKRGDNTETNNRPSPEETEDVLPVSQPVDEENNHRELQRGLSTTSRRKPSSQQASESERSTSKPSRGRGNVRQGGGTHTDKNSAKGKTEDEVSEDDNYPDVYKQLKKAGNGPGEILALLKARKKQREAEQAQRQASQPLETRSSRASLYSDLKTEEDNVKPSIESPSTSTKRNRFIYSDNKDKIENPLRSSYRQRRVLNRSNSINSNNLNTDDFENIQDFQQSTSESSTYDRPREASKSRFNAKYSSKYTRQNYKEKGSDIPDKTEKTTTSEKNIYKTLNNLGLNPQTLETTEPITERERFIPSSKRTKSFNANTESIEVAQSSTFKPRYQLYQSKNRKSILEKRFGNSKESLEKASVKEKAESDKYNQVRRPFSPSLPRGSNRYRNKPSTFTLPPEDEQEPVTVHFVELDNKIPMLESLSQVSENVLTTSNNATGNTSDSKNVPEDSTALSSTIDSNNLQNSTLPTSENNVVNNDVVASSSTSEATTINYTTPQNKPTTELINTTSASPTPTSTPLFSSTLSQSPLTTELTLNSLLTLSTVTIPSTSAETQPSTIIKTTTPMSTTSSSTSIPSTIKSTTTVKTTIKPTVSTTKKPAVKTTVKTTTKMPTTVRQQTITTSTKKPTTIKPKVTTTKKPTTKLPLTTTTMSTTTVNQMSTPASIQAQPNQMSQKVNQTKDNIITRSEFLNGYSNTPAFMPTVTTINPTFSSPNSPRTEATLTQNSADFVAYALLPNNTLVRRVAPRSTMPPTEIPFVVYGLYPNGTIVKRYPNGTVVPDDPSPETNELVGEVDPTNTQELTKILERDRPLAYLYPSSLATSTVSTFTSSLERTSSTTPPSTTMESTLGTQSSTNLPVSSANKTILSGNNMPTKTGKLLASTSAPTTVTFIPTTPLTTTSKPKPTTQITTTTTPKPITSTTSTSTTTTALPSTTQFTTTNAPTTLSSPSVSTANLPSTTVSSTSTIMTTTIPPKPITTLRTTTSSTTQKPTKLTTTQIPTTQTKPMPRKKTTTSSTTPISISSTTELLTSTQDTISSSSESVPSSTGLTPDDFALLNSLLQLQSDNVVSSNSISAAETSPTGPDDDDIANRIIQLAIERAQTSTEKNLPTDGSDLQELLSSPQPNFGREGKSISPPLDDSTGVESSTNGGKISVWVVPETETEETTKATQKLTPEQEQVLTALLAAPQSPQDVSLRDQLLLAELLAAGQNNANGGLTTSVSTTKRPRKKKRPTTRPPPPPPTLSPLAALFGSGGRGGGLFGSGAAPPLPEEEGDGEGGYQNQRPQGGILVNAAINITRAVSQFMGLVLQGAAQSFGTFLASRTRNFADYFARGGGIS